MSTDAASHPKVPVKGGVVAYLQVDGALKAADWYVQALDATIALAMPPDDAGRSMHVHIYVNGSSIMMSDPYPEQGCALEAPQGFNLMILVDDIEAWWQRAMAAGATAVMEPADMFWGDHYAQFRDPFDVLWALNQGAG